MPARRIALFALCSLLLATAASAATPPLRFTSAPARAVQGTDVTFAIAVRKGARCAIGVRYADGAVQKGLRALTATHGRARWGWRVPMTAEPGAARVTVSCGRAGRIQRRLTVVGSVIPARIVVEKQGFSLRQRLAPGGFGAGSTALSYGLLLRNASPNQDARNVSVLVNFVGADNKLVGSASSSIAAIGAGATYAFGNSLSFTGLASVDRLEVVIQIGAREKPAMRLPAVTNLYVAPGIFEPQWVGEIGGEVVNDHPTLILQNARLSVVIVAPDGRILGGGTGYTFASLPPGARQFFKVTSGFDAVAFDPSVSLTALVSVEPTWAAPS